MERKNKEKKIIDSFYEIYKLYPDYYLISKEFENVEHDKAVRNVHKAKETLKSALISGIGVCFSEIAGLDLNGESFLAVLGVTIGGGITLYEMSKGDLDLYNYSKKDQKRIIKDFNGKCDLFDNALNDYAFFVHEYFLDYCNDGEIDWFSILDKIFSENDEYINNKQEKGLFVKDYNKFNAFRLHNEIFEIEKFNDSLYMLRELYTKKKDKIRTKNK